MDLSGFILFGTLVPFSVRHFFYDWSWAIYLELQNNSQFVDASARPGEHGKVPTVHQGWFLPAPSLGAGQQRSQGTLTYVFSCLHLLAAC